MFSVEDPDPVTVAGLNVPVAPAGKPLTLRFTVPENPFKGVMLAVSLVPDPCCTAWLDGDAEIVKSGLDATAGRISTIARLYLSVIGAASLMVTVVPLKGVTL